MQHKDELNKIYDHKMKSLWLFNFNDIQLLLVFSKLNNNQRRKFIESKGNYDSMITFGHEHEISFVDFRKLRFVLLSKIYSRRYVTVLSDQNKSNSKSDED